MPNLASRPAIAKRLLAVRWADSPAAMRYPPRLSHLATRAVVVARLFPTYADAHDLDDEEARSRLTEALSGDFLEQVLASTWEAIRAKSPRLSEAELLDKIAQNLTARPLRPGRKAQVTPAW